MMIFRLNLFFFMSCFRFSCSQEPVGKYSTVTWICCKVIVICFQRVFICSLLPDDEITHLSSYFHTVSLKLHVVKNSSSFPLCVFCWLQYHLLKDIFEKWKSIPDINKGKIIKLSQSLKYIYISSKITFIYFCL